MFFTLHHFCTVALFRIPWQHFCCGMRNVECARVKAQKLRYEKAFAFSAVGPPQKVKHFIRRRSRLQHVMSRPLHSGAPAVQRLLQSPTVQF